MQAAIVVTFILDFEVDLKNNWSVWGYCESNFYFIVNLKNHINLY
jgi:hypothetical protein